VEDDLLHTDGKTDIAELIESFCSFAKLPKNWLKGVKAHSVLPTFLRVGIQRLASLKKEEEYNL